MTRTALDNWQVAGIASFVSGTPSTVGFTTTDSVDLTGGGDGIRVNVTGRFRSKIEALIAGSTPMCSPDPLKESSAMRDGLCSGCPA